ncbi:MAG: hypothetical protein IJ558_05960 [Treponema sp.]|nr:hypothetical protein [Treponema sp.]
MKNQRTQERFDDFARVVCSDLCIVSGVLTDISENGFKAEFNAPCEIDEEKEYTVQLRLSRITADTLELTVQPVWSAFTDGKTTIGFSILHSKDSARLDQYIKLLRADKSSEDDTGVASYDSSSLFI